jgi:glycosyltransferase involved in cell wall biosynthesis
MKILLCNKFYYFRGGDCTCVLNLEQLLKNYGHKVAIFSMQYPSNLTNEWNKYWPNNMNIPNVFIRPFGSHEVIKKFTTILDEFHPEIVHLHNIHTQLSPIIAQISHEKGIRVVWTLHDSKLVCPCYTCMRKGKWCTECFTDKKAVIKHRCMPGGLLGSIIGYLEIMKWNPQKLQKYTDLFLPPSQFMADTCIAGGYDASKFRVLCNFIDESKVKNPCFEKEDYYVFLGRLTKVKGIETLCKAANDLPYRLIVVGGGELKAELNKQYARYKHIEFVGQKNWEELRPILEKARFMVIPSEWSENNPLSVIESQSLGTPVLGANIGGIPELIQEGMNGMTFESGNIKDLKNKIQKMFDTVFDYKKIAQNAIEKYSSETYYNKLMEYYKG